MVARYPCPWCHSFSVEFELNFGGRTGRITLGGQFNSMIPVRRLPERLAGLFQVCGGTAWRQPLLLTALSIMSLAS